MKKWMIFPVVLLLLLTACQPVPDSESEPTGSTPPSSSITPPSSSSNPVSSSPTSDGTQVGLLDYNGYSFVYKGSNPYINMDPDYSRCKLDGLYWVNKETEKVTAIYEDPVVALHQTETHIFYVRAGEPTKIYRTSISNFAQHEVIYESSYGSINYITIDTFQIRKQLIMQMVVDNKKFVILDLDAGVDAVLMEQYYIRIASMCGAVKDTWQEIDEIYFEGQPTAEERDWDYLYNLKTGECRLENHFHEN